MNNKIFHFLENSLINKKLVTDEVVYTLGNGKLEGIYNDQMIFSNLVKTENGFKFNMTALTHELIYNLDEKGVRTTIAKDYTGTSVFCYELAMRKSTNHLTGWIYSRTYSKVSPKPFRPGSHNGTGRSPSSPLPIKLLPAGTYRDNWSICLRNSPQS